MCLGGVEEATEKEKDRETERIHRHTFIKYFNTINNFEKHSRMIKLLIILGPKLMAIINEIII